MRRLLRISIAMAVVILITATPHVALAKWRIPAEVQITSGDRTVRTPSNILPTTVQDGTLGFVETPEPARAFNSSPATIRYIVFTDPEAPRNAFHEPGPGLVRRTLLVVSYYSAEGQVVGQIRTGGDERLFTVGQWVRFTPEFVGLVDGALKSSSTVAAISPPPYQSQPHPASLEAATARVQRTILLLALGVLLVLGIPTALILLLSRRAMRKELQKVEPWSTAV